jgi:hypothetical protein
MTVDTTGMLCTCGKRLYVISKDDGGCCTLTCPNKKCEKFYKIPLIPGTLLSFPWETRRVREYKCRKCNATISEDQAKTTFKELDKALCEACAT